jgi:hypothetical protein
MDVTNVVIDIDPETPHNSRRRSEILSAWDCEHKEEASPLIRLYYFYPHIDICLNED